jgi:adenosylhomocysteine nucleosidase
MHLVSPLEFERSALRALAGARGWTLERSGPGADAIARWAARAALPAGSVVVLAGVAGSLRPRPSTGDAVEVSSVVAEDGRRFVPDGRLTALPQVRCLSAREPIGSPDAKRAEAARDRADVVDLESAEFARVAIERGWRWHVVRGISDGHLDALPPGIDRWTDSEGRTRIGAVLGALLRRQATPGDLVRIGRASTAAMRAVAAALAAVQSAR